MPAYLHTCYRIGDIDRSVSFYEKLGFQEARRMPIGDDATNVFMALPGENPVLERGDGDGTPLRWSFNEITPTSFVWRGEVASVGGEPWRLVEEMRLRRTA